MTRRTIQLPVLVASLIAAIVLVPAVYCAHGWQLSRLARGLLAFAEREEKQQNWLHAAEFLDRFLRIHPHDAHTRSRLAIVYTKGATNLVQKRRAVQMHYRALAAEPSVADENRLRCGLAELLVTTGRLLEAEKEAGRVIANDPQNPAAHKALAVSLFAQWRDGSLAAANPRDLHVLRIVESARRLNPLDVPLAELAAAIYRSEPALVTAEFPEANAMEREARANACLDELVEKNPTDPCAWLARYHYRARHELPMADADLNQAVQVGPDDAQVLMTAAAAAYRKAEESRSRGASEEAIRGHLQSAKQLYERLMAGKSMASRPEPEFGLGDALLALQERESALRTWKQGLKKFSQPTVQIRFHARIVDALLSAAQISEVGASLDAIDGILATLGNSVSREERIALVQAQDTRRASWHLKRRQPAAAVPLLQDVLARQSSGSTSRTSAATAWNLLGQANIALGEWGEAAVSFDRAIPLQPTSQTPRLSAAYAWLQMGRSEIAIDRAEQALAVQPSMDALFVLAAAEYQAQLARPSTGRSWARFERTLQALEQAAARSQVEAPWRIDFLRAELANIIGVDSGNIERGRAEALDVLEKAEPKYPEEAAFWRQASLAYQRLEDIADADRALERFESLTTSAAEIAIAKASLAVLRKDHDRALQVLQRAIVNVSADDQSRLRMQLLDVAFVKRDLELANQLLVGELRNRAGDITLLRRLTELARERGDREAADRWQAELMGAGPLGQWWARYFRAMRLYRTARASDDPQLAEALQEQAKLAAIRPHWPISFTLRGMIEQKMEREEQAVASYERAVQLGERNYDVFEQLIALLDKRNRSAEAEGYLARLEGYMPHSQRLTEIAANQHLRHERPEQALEIARKAVRTRPDDALAHLWLGRLLLVTDQSAAAEQELAQAIELAPQDVRVWNGMFSFHLRNKNTSKAREILQELEQQVTLNSADRNFVIAQGYELLGDLENATKKYEAAVQAGPDRALVHVRLAGVYLRHDPQRAAASLRRALEIDPQLTVARRMLAALLAANGSAIEFQEAEKLLGGDAISSEAIAVEDRRLNAILLAQYGQPAQVERAIQLLQQLVAQGEGSLPGDRVVLARLYEMQARGSLNAVEAAEKKAIARKELISAATMPGASSGHVMSLIDFLTRNNESEEAARWLDKLEETLRGQTRDNPQQLGQLIELLIATQHPERCADWLNRLEKIDSDPARAIALRARWLNTIGRTDEIGPLVEASAKLRLENAADALARARVARSVGDIYLTTGQLEDAERWYRIMAEDDPRQFSMLVLALAREGKFDSAIQVCRGQAEADDTPRAAIALASALVDTQAKPESVAAAEPIFAMSLGKFPNDLALLYQLATLRAAQANHGESIRLYRKLIALEPKHIPALNNLALMLAEQPRDRAEALGVVEKAISIIGQQPGLLDTKGTILLSQGRPQVAVSLLEAAVREERSDVRYRFHLAVAYRDVGDLVKAREELQSALEQQLERQFLTQMDRKLLRDLKTALIP